jgi:hypothetical protein
VHGISQYETWHRFAGGRKSVLNIHPLRPNSKVTAEQLIAFKPTNLLEGSIHLIAGIHGAQYLIVHRSKGLVMFWKDAGGKNGCQQVACRAILAELDDLLWGASRVVDGGIQWCSFERGAMRMLRRIILVVTTILAVAPATAQRYDPRYPVCFQKWGEGGFTAIDCSYTSLDQCRMTASGRSAMCYDNPYWPRAHQASPGGVHRRQGRVY